MFCDEVKINLAAGKGGDGAITFRREKFVPHGGPDGGDGGKGGSIFLVADNNLHTLSNFRAVKSFMAPDGEKGMHKKMHGKNAEDLFIKVPTGTMIYEASKKNLIKDMIKVGDKYLICRGGRGGFGNSHFRSSTRQAPSFAEKGEPGEKKEIILEIKMIAEVGIIGLPSAGKSTLISRISNAKPKIAAYHFTTLVPNLGVVEMRNWGGNREQSFIVADLPGLIEGASQGKGLGHQFLKHVQRTKVLVHMVDGSLDDLASKIRVIRGELKKYDKNLRKKKEFVVINKIDILQPLEREKISKQLKKDLKLKKIYLLSGVTGEGLKELLLDVWKELSVQRLKKEENKETPVFVNPTVDDDKKVNIRILKKRGVKVFELTGKRLEQIAIMTDFSNEEAVKRIYDVLLKTRVLARLLKLKAKDGDILKIGEQEIVFLKLLQ